MAWPYARWGITLGIEGIYSLATDDSDNNLPTGPSALFDGFNRQVFSPYLGMNFTFGPVILGLKASKTLFGNSTDDGWKGHLLFSYVKGGITQEKRKVQAFKEYLLEATVIKISPRGKFIEIDKGVDGDVEKGMEVDIFQSDFFGGNVLVASGYIYRVDGETSIVRLNKRYQDIPIKNGFTARMY